MPGPLQAHCGQGRQRVTNRYQAVAQLSARAGSTGGSWTVADAGVAKKLPKQIGVRAELRRPGCELTVGREPLCACFAPRAGAASPQRARDQQVESRRHAAPPVDAEPLHHVPDIGGGLLSRRVHRIHDDPPFSRPPQKTPLRTVRTGVPGLLNARHPDRSGTAESPRRPDVPSRA